MSYKENFQITDAETGKIFWISRSMAVCGIIFCTRPEDGKKFFLVERRGPGCPDFVGALACPCGYLGFGETRKEAVIREIKEEIGLDFSAIKEDIVERETEDRPEDNTRQNVTTRFSIPADYNQIKEYLDSGPDLSSKDRGGEEDEVSELVLVGEDELDNYSPWAWNHKELLRKYSKLL